MTFGQYYKIDEGYFVEIKPGEYVVKIESVVERQSKSGKPMLELKLRLENGGLVSYFLVDDQSDADACIRTNQRITKFFDCFRIKRGNFNIKQWQGAKGRVKLDYTKPMHDGSVFIEVKNLLVPSKDANNQGVGQHMQNRQPQAPQGMQNGQGVQNRQLMQEPQRMQQKPAPQGVRSSLGGQNGQGVHQTKATQTGGMSVQNRQPQTPQGMQNRVAETTEDWEEEYTEDFEEDFENTQVYEAPQKNKEGKTIDDIPFEPYQPCYKTEVEGGSSYSHSEGYEEPEIF